MLKIPGGGHIWSEKKSPREGPKQVQKKNKKNVSKNANFGTYTTGKNRKNVKKITHFGGFSQFKRGQLLECSSKIPGRGLILEGVLAENRQGGLIGAGAPSTRVHRHGRTHAFTPANVQTSAQAHTALFWNSFPAFHSLLPHFPGPVV